MTGTPSETHLGSWQVPECPFTIEYLPLVLDEIRMAVVDAYFSVPRGGAEIGGLLLGKHEAGGVRILASRAMECEHAFGPTFVLSDKDKARLGALLEELRQDRTGQGLEVVGWYHSHTRSEILLSTQDLEIYNEFCPEPWQISLVLRPAGMKPTRAGFFFRDPEGAVHTLGTYQEFIVEPGGKAPRRANGGRHVPSRSTAAPGDDAPPPRPPQVIPPSGDGDRPAAEAVAAAAVDGEAEEPGAALPSAAALLRRPELVPAPRPVDVGPAVEMRPAEFVPPAFLMPPERRRWRWLWPILALLAVGTAAWFTAPYWLKWRTAQATYLHLQALDMNGQLRIEWDGAALASKDVTGGTVEITDGSSTTSVPLDALKVKNGSFQYARRSEMVTVHLTVRTAAGAPLEEFTSFIGAAPHPADAQQLERDKKASELAAEAERARGDLRKQELRTLELQRSLEQMRQQMRREEERKRVENQVPAGSSAPVSPPVKPPVAAAETPSASRPVSAANPTAERTQPPASAPPPSAERPQNPMPSVSSPVPAGGPPAPAAAPLSGRWVFSPASKSGSPFPPESVSLAMTEANGQVRGILVGRYRVPKNRKFTPQVRFNFEGAVRPGSSKFPFAAADGMKGEIEVIRLPGKQDAIEVVWYSERDKLTFDDIFFRVP